MTRTMPMMEARKRLTSLPEELGEGEEPGVVEITRRGKPVLAVMPWELYETIAETLEVMADEELLARLRAGVAEMEAGKGVSWDEARRELDL